MISKKQSEELRELFKLSVMEFDNNIKHAKIMEESYKLQVKQAVIRKKQQERLIKRFDKFLKREKKTPKIIKRRW